MDETRLKLDLFFCCFPATLWHEVRKWWNISLILLRRKIPLSGHLCAFTLPPLHPTYPPFPLNPFPHNDTF